MMGFRHLQFFMLFLVAVIAYGMRSNMSEAIVAIIDEDHKKPSPDIPTYPEWADKKNIILSSFFWGYICLQVLAGHMAKRYGPKWFMVGGVTISTLFSFLIPFFANWFGWGGVLACRIMQGLSQGFLFPSMHHLITKWAHPSERSQMVTLIYAGGPLGTAIAMPLTGLMGTSRLGWPMAFYLYGMMGVVWIVLYSFFGSNSPKTCKWISEEEAKFLASGLDSNEDDESRKHLPTPWKHIFTSLPLWAILLAHFGIGWTFWTMFTEIPSYMNFILKFDLGKNSVYSALPYITLYVLGFLMSPIADYLITRNIWSIGLTRKVFTAIGSVLPGIGLIWLSFVGSEHKTLAIVLLILSVGASAGGYVGVNVNHIDICPNHAGTLMGITNSIAAISAILAPLSVDFIKTFGYKETDPKLWSFVFLTSAFLNFAIAIFYSIFASGEVQYWNNLDSTHR